MRLSTAQIFQQGINGILNQQSRLTHTQQQISTGQRLLATADDPGQAVRALDMSREIAAVEQYQRNADGAQAQLALEESTLGAIGNTLQRVRELVLQANNDTQTPASRNAIAAEIKALRDELLSRANTRDANGEYLFAGFQLNAKPFDLAAGQAVYSGDQGQRLLQIGPATQVAVNDSGARVFLQAPEGNGVFTVQHNPANSGSAVVGQTSVSGPFQADVYTLQFSQPTATDPVTWQVSGAVSGVVASGNYAPGDTIGFAGAQLEIEGQPSDGDRFTVAAAGRQDIFATVNEMISALESSALGAQSSAVFHNRINRALEQLDEGMDHVLEVRAEVGVRLNSIDSQRAVNDEFVLQVEEVISSIQDLDYAEAISRLNLQQVALQAAQQAYLRVQGLSLFKYL